MLYTINGSLFEDSPSTSIADTKALFNQMNASRIFEVSYEDFIANTFEILLDAITNT